MTLATWDGGFSRFGPGLVLRDLRKGEAQAAAGLAVIRALNADILVLTGTDYDASGAALAEIRAGLGGLYPFGLALRPNTGVPTGLDLDHDGAMNGPRDAQGFGRFPGQAGIAVLSKYPLHPEAMRDASDLLWRDLPGADLPPDMSTAARAVQRLATTGFYDLPVTVEGRDLHLLIYAATPPVFDGPEDRNGRRNADETRFWLHLLQGDLPLAPPPAPFAVIGQPNLDPARGDGDRSALRALLASPLLQDPDPRDSAGQDATWTSPSGWGLRLDMVLPSSDVRVTGAGIFAPAPADPLAEVLASASDHRPVWVTIDLP